jgi:hypothetical protein
VRFSYVEEAVAHISCVSRQLTRDERDLGGVVSEGAITGCRKCLYEVKGITSITGIKRLRRVACLYVRAPGLYAKKEGPRVV